MNFMHLWCEQATLQIFVEHFYADEVLLREHEFPVVPLVSDWLETSDFYA